MIHKFRHHYYPELQSLHEQCNWLHVNLGLDAKHRAQDLQPNELRLVQFASLLANVIQQVEMLLANPLSLLDDVSGATELERTILQGILPVKQKLTSRLKEVRSNTRPASGTMATGAALKAPSMPGSGGAKSISSGYTSGSTSSSSRSTSSSTSSSSSSRSSSEASGHRQSSSKPDAPATAQESTPVSSVSAVEGTVGAWSRMRAEKGAEAARQAEDAAFVAPSSSAQGGHDWQVSGPTSDSSSSSSSGESGSTTSTGGSGSTSSSAGTSPLVVADSFSPFDDDELTADPSLCFIAPHGDAPLFAWEEASMMHATYSLDWDASLAASFAASVGEEAASVTTAATRIRQPTRVSVASSSSSINVLKRRTPPSASDFTLPLTSTHANEQTSTAGDAPATVPEEEFLSQRRRRRLNTIVPNPRRPREAEFVCSMCNEGYRATTTDNPWWSCARQECPKCLCMQVPRFDINNSANGLEHDPNSQALFGDGVEDSGEDGNAEEDGEGGGEEDGEATGGDALASGTAGACAFGGEGRLSVAEASQLLVLMCHARGCSGQHQSEGHASVCRSVKLLMLHLRDCPVAPASVPSSSSSSSASSSSSSSDSCSAPSSSSSCINNNNNNTSTPASSSCLYPWCGPGKRFLDHLTHCYDGPVCGVCRPTDEALPATLAALRTCSVCR